MGVIAAALGYLLSYLLVISEVQDVFGTQIADWKGVAWFFYNAHMVDIQVTGDVAGFGTVESIDFIAQSTATGADLLYLVPPVVLLLVGGLLAYQLDVADIGTAVLVGTPVTLGYVVVLGLGALVARSSTEATFFGVTATGSISPALLPAVLLGGVLYPLVFATAGAVVVTVYTSSTQ